MIEVVAVVLVVLPLASWYSAILLIHAARRPPPIRLLSAIAAAAGLGAAGSTLLVPLALGRLFGMAIGPPVSTILLLGGILLLSLPGPLFLAAYRSGWLHGGGS